MGFLEPSISETDSSLLLLITATFPRLPFLTVSFFGSSVAFALAAGLAVFFAGAFVCSYKTNLRVTATESYGMWVRLPNSCWPLGSQRAVHTSWALVAGQVPCSAYTKGLIAGTVRLGF